ncbi:MAG: GMC family oxidoreductase N-terminal domain-containing protein [Hyphomicrobium sp.]
MQPRLSRPATELKPRYDAIVVGSGYGAGVAASRLARCGRSVAVLERGREFLPGDFPVDVAGATKELQVSARRMHTGSATALFDVHLNDDIHVLKACGLGGTSLINANVCLSPDVRIFEDAAWPLEVRRDRLLAEGYVRARHMLRPEPSARTSSYEKVKALRLAASSFERGVQPIPLHVVYKSGSNAAGVHQEACTECGDCCGGCNIGAKTTVASTYLADAAAFGAEIFTEIRVLSLTKGDDGIWQVWVQSASDVRKASLEAAIVVLGAGTLGSTEILLRSQAQGLALSQWLGSRFTSNGDVVAMAYNNDIPVNGVGVGNPPKADVPPVGQAVNALLDMRDNPQVRDGLALCECALPSSFAAMLPALLVPGGAIFGEHGSRPISYAVAAAARAGTSGLKGSYEGAVHNTQTFLAVGHDAGNGLMRLENDRLTIEWTNGPGQRVFQRIEAALKTAAEATGGSFMRNPASERILGGNLMTVHPLGGCTMGADRSSGVVNHKGQVFDAGPGAAPNAVHTGLYVSDGAVVPCPLGIHPLLTITALAERAMIHLARDYGWEMDTRDVQPGALEARYRPPAKKKRSFAFRAPWRRGEAAGTGGT